MHLTTSFREKFINYNHLEDFKEWVFLPGMLFRSARKWWGNEGARPRPHEGLDICRYRDKHGNEHSFGKGTVVPVIYRGEIARIEDDFLGRTLYVAHDFIDPKGDRLYTIYGHISPACGKGRGVSLEEGDIIGTIAAPCGRKANIPAHLHISVALISRTLNYDHLTWKTINDPRVVSLRDPLKII